MQVASPYTVDETLRRLESVLAERGVRLFALIDHSGEAEKVGMKMRPTKLVIFGNPKGGTPVMVAAPTLAIDLPLKALVWEDEGGKVWVTYNTSGVFAAAARGAGGADQEYCSGGRAGGQGCGIMLRALFFQFVGQDASA